MSMCCSACGFTIFFFWLHFSKPYLMSVPKIIEITYTIYQGLSKIVQGICRNKSHNMSEFNFSQNFAFACSPSLSLRVITWLESTIQQTTHCLVSGQLQKITQPRCALDLSLRCGHVILVSEYLASTAVN